MLLWGFDMSNMNFNWAKFGSKTMHASGATRGVQKHLFLHPKPGFYQNVRGSEFK
jgi:hypothetical protein